MSTSVQKVHHQTWPETAQAFKDKNKSLVDAIEALKSKILTVSRDLLAFQYNHIVDLKKDRDKALTIHRNNLIQVRSDCAKLPEKPSLKSIEKSREEIAQVDFLLEKLDTLETQLNADLEDLKAQGEKISIVDRPSTSPSEESASSKPVEDDPFVTQIMTPEKHAEMMRTVQANLGKLSLAKLDVSQQVSASSGDFSYPIRSEALPPLSPASASVTPPPAAAPKAASPAKAVIPKPDRSVELKKSAPTVSSAKKPNAFAAKLEKDAADAAEKAKKEKELREKLEKRKAEAAGKDKSKYINVTDFQKEQDRLRDEWKLGFKNS